MEAKMNELINKIVQITGMSLEQEDKLLLGATAGYSALSNEPRCGLLRNGFNEHHYQYIIGRALMISFPYIIKLEAENRTDILVKYPDVKRAKSFAAIEIKTFFSDNQKENEGIKSDINDKLRKSNADYRLMMIISLTIPKNCTVKKEQEDLRNRKNIGFINNEDKWYYYNFNSYNANGDDCVFWVGTNIIKEP